MALSCPSCDLATVDFAETTDDGQTRLYCRTCQHDWVHRPRIAIPATPPRSPARVSLNQAKAHFPTEADLTDSARHRLTELKGDYLSRQPMTDARVGPYFTRYREIFSSHGLPKAAPADLKAFANNDIGAHPGNMSVFNRAWNELGDRAAADRVRGVIDYLLRGTEEPIEDRMQTLIDARGALGMTGFKESLLTRTLCVMYPDRFLPILTYSSPAGGKKEIAASVFGLELPAMQTTSMTTGRLVFWSNDLLLRLCGTGFADVAHASQFLWWAQRR